MKPAVQFKKPFGKGTFSRVKHARYLGWEDACDVEFDDGPCFLEPHSTIRKANRISAKAVPVHVEVDEELRSHFKITYDTGEIAEVSSAFIRELPPRAARQVARRIPASGDLSKTAGAARRPAAFRREAAGARGRREL